MWLISFTPCSNNILPSISSHSSSWWSWWATCAVYRHCNEKIVTSKYLFFYQKNICVIWARTSRLSKHNRTRQKRLRRGITSEHTCTVLCEINHSNCQRKKAEINVYKYQTLLSLSQYYLVLLNVRVATCKRLNLLPSWPLLKNSVLVSSNILSIYLSFVSSIGGKF